MIAFLQARWYRKFNGIRPVDFIVIHDEEYPESDNSAEAIAQMFHTTTRPASAHQVHDANSTVQCVLDNDVAYHAPPNERSIGHEHDGYAHQTREEWLDPKGKLTLELSAAQVAEDCHQHNIPIVKLSPSDLLAGKRGICGHVDVSNAWHQTTHTDPGTQFPWDYYLDRVRYYYNSGSPLPLPDPPMVISPPRYIGMLGNKRVAERFISVSGLDNDGNGFVDTGLPWNGSAISASLAYKADIVANGYTRAPSFQFYNWAGQLRIVMTGGKPKMEPFNIRLVTAE